MILGGFYAFRADRTPPGPMNLLCITMVWGAFGRPGARRGAFPTFYVKIMENHKIMKFLNFYEILRNLMKIMKFVEVLDFAHLEAPKP